MGNRSIRGRRLAFLVAVGLLSGCAVSLAGTWNGTIQPGSISFSVTLSGSGSDYTGTFTVDGEGSGSLAATLSGSTVDVAGAYTSGPSSGVGFYATGTLSGNKIEGTWYDSDGASGTFSMTRQ